MSLLDLGRRLTLLAAFCSALPAAAHDTWFEPLVAQPGLALLNLGTGLRYPQQAFPIGPEQVSRSGCRRVDAAPVDLAPVRVGAKALLLRAGTPVDAAPSPMSCWAQLVPFDIELKPELIPVYLDEIAASGDVRALWAGIAARGLPWKERYTKHARIELAGGSGTGTAAASPMDMDILLRSGLQTIHAGDALVFEVQRGSQPLPGLALELVDHQGGSGGWFHTDARGRIALAAPTAGRWLLRGTELRASRTVPDSWDSGFVTLVFEVAPKTAGP
jgi:hypothetical protein